jgi:hypothetical protein
LPDFCEQAPKAKKVAKTMIDRKTISTPSKHRPLTGRCRTRPDASSSRSNGDGMRRNAAIPIAQPARSDLNALPYGSTPML